MLNNTISYSNSVIQYTRNGRGCKVLVCFHGYDQDSSSFNILCNGIANDFTCICIDLPFHGKSNWNHKEPITPAILENIIDAIFLQEQIHATTFILLGYSIGGRIALSFFEEMPGRVERLVLLAPDGFTNNFWFWLATQTYLGNKLFRFTVKKPAWILKLAETLYTFRIINLGVLKLAQHYLRDEQLAKQLYKRWTCFRMCMPNFKKIIKVVQTHHTPVRLIFGKSDHFILKKNASDFHKALSSLCMLTVINSGHHLLRQKYIAVLKEQLDN